VAGLEKSKTSKNERYTPTDRGQISEAPPQLRAPPLRTVIIVMEKGGACQLQKNPLVLLHVPSPPHGTIGPFRPRVQDNTTALPSYVFA
jgi:hypothetical protein